MKRSKTFRVGDRVRVKACSRNAGGVFAGRMGEVIRDDYSGHYPYLVSFSALNSRHRPFCAAELELVERPGGTDGQV